MADAGTGGASWADVAVASLRAVRDFDRFVAPVLEAHGVPALGMTNVLFLLAIGRRAAAAWPTSRGTRDTLRRMPATP